MRSSELRVKLAPSIAEAIGSIAAGRGLLPATLAAVALGEYVEKQSENAKLQRMVVLDVSKRMAESMTDERLEKIIGSGISPESMAAAAQIFSAAEEGKAGQAGSSAAPEAAASASPAALAVGGAGDRVRSAT